MFLKILIVIVTFRAESMINDKLNLRILEKICSGEGVTINVNFISKKLKKHRNTINGYVKELFEHNIIMPPYYPFLEMFNQRQLFAVVRADLPKNELVENFTRNDENIFAAFRAWDEGYNTLLFEFHQDMSTYFEWKEKIVKEGKLPHLEHRFPADVLFLNNKLLIKYEPNSSLFYLEKMFKDMGELKLNGYSFSELSFSIMKMLLLGEGIKTNENNLARSLNTHRRTIEKRINAMSEAGIVSKPVCRFPHFLVPPESILVFSMVRINNNKEKIIKYIKEDPHIPMAFQGHTGMYNLLYFNSFEKFRDHFIWEERLHEKFSDDSFGAMKKIYLWPEITGTIDPTKVILGVIRNKMNEIK